MARKMTQKLKGFRQDCAAMSPCIQLSIYPDKGDAIVCPICCEFIAFAKGNERRQLKCPVCGQKVIMEDDACTRI